MTTRRGFLIVLCGSALAQTGEDHVPIFGEVAAALGARPGAKIADVGAGQGRYTFRLASAVGPDGKVWAVDVTKSALRTLRRKAEEGKVGNVEVVEGTADDPRLPAGEFDGVLVVNAYHEMEEHASMLRHMRDALKPGGRLVIVDDLPGPTLRAKSRVEQQDRHTLDVSYVKTDLAEAGMEVLETRMAAELGHGSHYMVVARTRPPKD